MYKDQYEELLLIEPEQSFLQLNHIYEKHDRTLLAGVNYLGEKHHFYLKDSKLHLLTYKQSKLVNYQTTSGFEIKPLITYVSFNAECCDFQLCFLLRKWNYWLRFKQFDSRRKYKKFYLKTRWELSPKG